MHSNHKPIKSYVIVGGGTAGWTAAAVLSRQLNRQLKNNDITITLVESPHVPTIGVGEATIPSFVDLLAFLGISQRDFILKTNATFKLAIKFTDWLEQGHHYWHPFGTVGGKIEGKLFYQHWLKQYFHGNEIDYMDFSPAAVMAKHKKFIIPDPKQHTIVANSTHALHFDAALVADYFKSYAMGNGVEHIRGHVEQITQTQTGAIESVILADEKQIFGDFFIDCSGIKGLLINQTLRVGFIDWQHYLPVNSAVAVQTEKMPDLPPYTESTAHKNGWRWCIPLQNRTGNGFVYSTDFCSDEQAKATLLENVKGELLTEPRTIRFQTGVREKAWAKNCLAIGLSAGFLEPLESTSIYLVMRGMLHFVQMLPDQNIAEVTQHEYNRLMQLEYEHIRDFIVAHYCLSKRDDSAFWRMWQHNNIPNSLKTKLALYQSQGRIMSEEIHLFSDESWYAVLSGMAYFPNSYDPAVDNCDFDNTQRVLSVKSQELKQYVELLPSHQNFFDKL